MRQNKIKDNRKKTKVGTGYEIQVTWGVGQQYKIILHDLLS
jgi:hypothetical protein